MSREVIAQSHQTVKQGQETVQRGQEVVRESQKVSAVVHMNIVKDPVYGSNPELAAVFNESAREQDERLEDQQAEAREPTRSRLANSARKTWPAASDMFAVLISSSRCWWSASASPASSSPTGWRARSTR